MLANTLHCLHVVSGMALKQHVWANSDVISSSPLLVPVYQTEQPAPHWMRYPKTNELANELEDLEAEFVRFLLLWLKLVPSSRASDYSIPDDQQARKVTRIELHKLYVCGEAVG